MQYSENPDELKSFLEEHSGSTKKVIYDFDNTLFLDNSTNLYFNSIRPRWLVCLIFYFLNIVFDRFKIDRFIWEDYIKTVIGIYLFPLSYFRWKYRTAKYFARELLNEELLLNESKENRKYIIISFGHKEIIEPLLKHMGIDYELICSKILLNPKNIRRRGKLYYIEPFLEEGDKENCLFVTDSKDDSELLDYFERSFLLIWRKQSPVNFHNVYIPFKYTAKCKYVVKNILWNQHIGEDLVVLILAYGLFMPLDILSVVFLFISFFIVYEMGYYENDFKASENEDKPSLSGKQKEYINYPIYKYGILWALSTSAIGVYFLTESFITNYVQWLITLIALFFTFRIFNSIKPINRIYIFPFLQLFKTFSYTLFFKLNPIGLVLLFSQVMRQTTNYHIYRFGGNTKIFKRQNHRMLVFIILMLVLLVSKLVAIEELFTVQFALILCWLLQRSITRDLGGYRNSAKFFVKLPQVLYRKLKGS
ncbi:HAD family hydrolase [Vibrio sp. SCSIO 43137]|uniref:HAD family hydrolase n=1 Tax=Vibrio sp. SCSIO 43137 TaxID=3021011 RepID=UPI002307F835|nr:HAD family hydrolase [Vibrio sp. SCSIO 43137]WCE29877.1 HAD family hydrolase [Vibrio sp. SCSIO 43137]